MDFHTSSPPPPASRRQPSDLLDTWRPSPSNSEQLVDLPAVLDQRTEGRSFVRYPVAFALHASSRRAGTCRNLSLGGMQIQTADPLPFDSEIDIFIQLQGIPGESRLTGRVRWCKPGWMGVQLDAHGARATHAILQMASRFPTK